MSTATLQIQTPVNATLDTNAMAALLECSDRMIAKLDKNGKLPTPVRLGTLKRWVRADIDLWLSAGCPDREEFTKLKAETQPAEQPVRS